MKPHILRTAKRYAARLAAGEKILRRADGRIQWASGRKISRPAVDYLLSAGVAANLDTDLFGDKSRGQTIGLAPQGGAGAAPPAQPA